MHLVVAFVILLLLAIPFAIALSRANELFALRVRDGGLAHVRGRLPGRLFSDIADVVAHPPVPAALIRVVSEGGRPRVVARGLGKGQLQRVRNVVATFDVAQIRSGRRRSPR